MSLLTNIYKNSLYQNERNLRYWEDYFNSLKSLDLSVYADKLTVPALIPIGSRILFRGEIKHTNEVIVSLGADYFTKCSIKQAEVLRNHRIKDAQSKVDILKKEKEYLETQLSFKSNSLYEEEGKEIIEYETEEEDRMWRKKHRENVRDYMQRKKKDKEEVNVTDEEIWNRLEELELQEELENELKSEEEDTCSEGENVDKDDLQEKKEMFTKHKIETKQIENSTEEQVSKLDLLQQVLDKQHELHNKLVELKSKERTKTKTEQDLLSRLDELEQLDELEDDMERLDSIIDGQEDDDSDLSEPEIKSNAQFKRKVSFADEDDSETLELAFKHSDIKPVDTPYDPNTGILKPSDIYSAYPLLFSETTSILKKTTSKNVTDLQFNENPEFKKDINVLENDEEKISSNRTIIIQDVIEKNNDISENEKQCDKRPVSLFKKRRQQYLNQ